MRSALLLLTALLTVAACTDEATPPRGGAMQGAPPTETTPADTVALEPAEARMEAGVQVAEIEAGPTGFRPAAIALQAGVPARLVFTRTVESECSSQVRVPDFGVEATDLPMNEPIAIAFTPTEGGAFTFVCGMDMQRGTLVVQS